VLQASAQIEFIEQEELLISNETNWYVDYLVQIHNTTDSGIFYDWKIEIPDDIKENVKFSVHDTNIGWFYTIYSNCGYEMPNLIDSMAQQTLLFEFWVFDAVSPEKEHLIDSIEFSLLLHPDCKQTLGQTNASLAIPSNNANTEELFTEVYPNPNTGIIRFKNLPQENLPYQIQSLDGRLLQSGIIEENQIQLIANDTGLIILSYQHQGKNFYKKILQINE